jgi:hypothetical protein
VFAAPGSSVAAHLLHRQGRQGLEAVREDDDAAPPLVSDQGAPERRFVEVVIAGVHRGDRRVGLAPRRQDHAPAGALIDNDGHWVRGVDCRQVEHVVAEALQVQLEPHGLTSLLLHDGGSLVAHGQRVDEWGLKSFRTTNLTVLGQPLARGSVRFAGRAAAQAIIIDGHVATLPRVAATKVNAGSSSGSRRDRVTCRVCSSTATIHGNRLDKLDAFIAEHGKCVTQ